MCGIIGSVSKKFHFNQQHIDVIAHRGPDDSGYFFEDDVMLGHRRLSIVDLSANGHQPMFTKDGRYAMVFNGEIYNHEEIRARLLERGYQFVSTSDTETLLYGFAEWGTAVFQQLNGIFAVAIYDRQQKQLTVARDHFGIKPLYYYNQAGIFAFSSELKALTTIDGFDTTLNTQALFYYLQTLYAPGVLTPFRSVHKLLPGHFLQIDTTTGKLQQQQYYQLSFKEDTIEKTEEEWVDLLDAHLNRAVERQLMSDVPVGFFLSGGLDSSLLVAMAKKKLKEQAIPCFTIAAGTAMQEEGFADDEMYAKKVAAHLGVTLNILPANISITEAFDKMIWHLDEPQADPAPLNVLNICKGAREQGIKVLIGGTAGDDLFSGYRRHQALLLEPYYKYIPAFVRKGLGAVAKKLPAGNPLLRRLKKLGANAGATKAQRMAGYFMWMEESTVMSLFTPQHQQLLQHQPLPLQYWQQLLQQLPADTADLNKMLYLELNTFLPDHNLNYTDKMSMAVGVEARVPYLDTELVAFANSLPVKYKMQGKTTKYLLRKVAERYLPQDVIYRPKTGFGAPVRQWIRNDLQQRLQAFTTESVLVQQGVFNATAINQLIQNDKEGKTDAAYTIWSLLAIESWYRQFVK
ncbi:MAG: asparagine synthase (glutamine-hydrolyzing) [Flavihumibacter sp.]|nr:asparagine synthase (glutamine-hydrolyzing) [Flavihumibacter sp.]